MNENQLQLDPPTRITLACVIGSFGLILLGFIAWNWVTWGHVVALISFIVFVLTVIERAISSMLHKQLERKSVKQHHDHADHYRELTTRALAMGHSIQMKHVDHMGGTWEVSTISPFTIPNAPVNIESLNFGNDQEQLLPPPRQPLMEEMYASVAKNSLTLPFGRSLETGEIITQGIEEGVHFKLVGASGFGKSCLAAALLDVASKRNDPDHLRIALLDLENKTGRLFQDLPHILEMGNSTRRVRLHAKDPDEVARMLALLRKELDRRAASGIEKPLLLIYVEEMLSLRYEVDSKLLNQMLADLAILALRGRKYGMFLLACMQTDYSTKELREAQKQFRTRSGFALDPSAARAAGFTHTDLINENFENAKPGQFLLEKPAFRQLVLAPLYDVKMKLEEMGNPSRLYAPGSYGTSEGTSYPTSEGTSNIRYFNGPMKRAEVENEAPNLYAQIDSDRIQRVVNMMLEGLSVNKILEREWGVASSGGAYQAALIELREVQKIIAAKSIHAS